MNALRASQLVLVALGVSACSNLPGESLGTYKVTMALAENTCGTGAVFSLDKKRYSVELRSDTQHGYWRIPGQPPIQGRYEAPEFAFEFHSVVASSGPDAGPRGCRLVQLDQVTGSLLSRDELKDDDAGQDEDAGEDQEDASDAEDEGDDEDAAANEDHELDAGAPSDAAALLEGEHLMTISPEPGTDCGHDALQPEGAFERLPCKVRYTLTGLPIKPF